MDKKDKEYLKESLRNRRPHERFNEALARTLSDRMKNEEGYKEYIRLISSVRSLAAKKKISEVEAVNVILGR